jgi:nitrile hydratase beta subunit
VWVERLERYRGATDGVHDLGGMHGFGPVVVPGCEKPYHERWEPRVFAISELVGIEGIGTGSGRAIREGMEPAEYLRASYYERWLWSTEQRLLRKGTVTEGEVDRWVEELRKGADAPRRIDPAQAKRVLAALRVAEPLTEAEHTRFSVGESVRVRRQRPEGHTRCPRYVRGVTGVVERVRGVDTFPDVGPYEGPEEPVYSVAFRSSDVFGPSGEGVWSIRLDLFESYLEPT